MCIRDRFHANHNMILLSVILFDRIKIVLLPVWQLITLSPSVYYKRHAPIFVSGLYVSVYNFQFTKTKWNTKYNNTDKTKCCTLVFTIISRNCELNRVSYYQFRNFLPKLFLMIIFLCLLLINYLPIIVCVFKTFGIRIFAGALITNNICCYWIVLLFAHRAGIMFFKAPKYALLLFRIRVV